MPRRAESGARRKPPDGGAKTLHVRCGDDIREALGMAGFAGQFGTFSYPFVHGPAPRSESRSGFIEIAAAFLVEAGFVESEARARRRLKEEFDLLDDLGDFDRVSMWFEHDAYDILCLVFLLDWYSRHDLAADLTYICVDSHPSVESYRGLGQLSHDVLADLWSDFRPVTPELMRLGAECWQAYASPDPTALWKIVKSGTPVLPQISPALHRQLKELPDRRTGLSLTEGITLQILQERGQISAGELFRLYTLEYEPLAFMGDLGFKQCVLMPLSGGETPLVEMLTTPETDGWWRSTKVDIADTGRRVLSGDVDYLHLASVNRWVGGTHIVSGEPVWRWSDDGPVKT